jgi:glucans biosynthesis protein
LHERPSPRITLFTDCSFLRPFFSLLIVGHLLFFSATTATASESCFTHAQQKAKQLSEKAYEPRPRMGEKIRNLSYHDYQNITFIPGETFWRKEALPFQLEFMHPGMQFDQAVELFTWQEGKATPITFNRKFFHYAGLDRYFDDIASMGYTGFRVLFPIHGDAIHNEFLVFQGASYFRSRGNKEDYGLSARGLALNTSKEGQEEFPAYTHFWFEKPPADAKTLTICALMNSPSLTGATEFRIKPDGTTFMDVNNVVFPRTELDDIGIAPLTSMFFHGENALSTYGDFRPEVHDSDGLLVKTDTWEWHPLREAEWVEEKNIHLPSPKGFGLLQRDRNFDHYQDINARYQARTSAWVEPLNDWGDGRLKLIQHSTDNDIQDNVVAYWSPKENVAGKPFKYRLHWGTPAQTDHSLGKVHATRISSRDAERVLAKENVTRFIIDFFDVEKNSINPTIRKQLLGTGSFVFEAVEENPYIDGWRVLLYLETDKCDPPPEMSLQLIDKENQQALSEIWHYRLPASLCRQR